MPDLIFANLFGAFMQEIVVRALLVYVGVGAALHYFLACKAMEDSTHMIRLGTAFVAGLGVMCVWYGLQGPAYPGSIIGTLTAAALLTVHVVIWGQGIFMRDQLNRAIAMKRAAKQARQESYNVYRSDLTAPWEAVKDFVTPSGFDEIKKSEERAKERA